MTSPADPTPTEPDASARRPGPSRPPAPTGPDTAADHHLPSLAALLSRTLGAANADNLDAAVEACLAHIGRFAGVDMTYALLVDDDEYVSHAWSWSAPGESYEGPGAGMPMGLMFSSSIEVLRLGRVIAVSDLDTIELSPVERLGATHNDLRGVALAPVRAGGTLLGVCGLQTFHRPREWEPEVVEQLEALAQQLIQGAARVLERGALAVASARAQRIAEFIPDGLALLDLDGTIRWASPSLLRMSGRPAGELVGQPATELVPTDDAADLAEGLAVAGDEAAHRVARARTPDGWRWADLTWRVVSDPEGAVPDEIVFSWRDIHERHLELLAMTALAQLDELTALANRSGLTRHLERLAAQGVAVLYVFIDLDGFKAINDTWGHPEGDRVLTDVAGALQSAVRPDDVVARVGGDEFAIVIAPPFDPSTLGDRLLAGVRTVSVGGRAVTASVGIAGPVPAGDLRLHQLADDAMYEAKRCGKDAWAHIDGDRRLRTGPGA